MGLDIFNKKKKKKKKKEKKKRQSKVLETSSDVPVPYLLPVRKMLE